MASYAEQENSPVYDPVYERTRLLDIVKDCFTEPNTAFLVGDDLSTVRVIRGIVRPYVSGGITMSGVALTIVGYGYQDKQTGDYKETCEISSRAIITGEFMAVANPVLAELQTAVAAASFTTHSAARDAQIGYVIGLTDFSRGLADEQLRRITKDPRLFEHRLSRWQSAPVF